MFEVSLIDNVHSDIIRLRGFYGHLLVEGRDLVLVEARSGVDQIRWSIKSLKTWFCAKVSHKEDRSGHGRGRYKLADIYCPKKTLSARCYLMFEIDINSLKQI